MIQAVQKLLQPDLATDEKYRIFLQSVRYLRQSEQDASYHEMLKQLSELAQKVMQNEGAGKKAADAAMQQYVQAYQVFLAEKNKYQVYLAGSLYSCEKVRLLLNYDRVHLLGWTQTADERIGRSDYCIVCSTMKEHTLHAIAGMQHTFVVRYDLVRHFVMGILPECQGLDIRFREKLKSKVEGAVLGLSYVRKLNFDKLKHHIACFAASSHDLFLDYHKLMWIYDEVVHKHGGELKYCVLGMDFYRLWYDLSMSAYKERMMCMYHKLHCVHHFHELDAALGRYEEDLKICEELLVENYMDQEYHRESQIHEKREANVYDPTEEEYQRDISILKGHVFHKPYPHTFCENVGILEKILKFSRLRNIQILVYIPPFTKVFHACTPDSMRKDTWDVLRELQKLYAFPILDLSEHSAFEKKHFADCAHLNDDGADLATELLNLYMDEIW